jgi:GAF domain-containing protein
MGASRVGRSGSRALAVGGERVVTTARELFRVRRAALFWRDGRSRTLICVASAGDGGGEGWIGERLPAGVGVAGRAVAERRPAWSPDLLADPRIPLADWLRERLTRETLHVVAAAPLSARGRVLGALGLLDGAGRTYGKSDLRLLGRFAELAAEALRGAVAPAGRTGGRPRRRRQAR